MDMQTEGVRRGRKPKGRVEPDKQEATVDVTAIRDRIDELVKLHKAAEAAADESSEAIKKAAEDSGLNASAVRSYVTARAGENYEKAKQKCEQLNLLFEEIPG